MLLIYYSGLHDIKYPRFGVVTMDILLFANINPHAPSSMHQQQSQQKDPSALHVVLVSLESQVDKDSGEPRSLEVSSATHRDIYHHS